MILFPSAKINVGLWITAVREDGYHQIESFFYPVPWHDVLEFSEAATFSLRCYGRKIPGKNSENILTRTWQLLHRRFGIPAVKVALLKNIPPGSGLGGGSSDAAFFLKGLHDYFRLNLSYEVLFQLALQLGSDCPFFLQNKPALVSGRGEHVQPLDIRFGGLWLLIVFPGLGLSTAKMFSAVTPYPRQVSLLQTVYDAVEKQKFVFQNDFEPVAFARKPVLAEIKQKMLSDGALFASLTGSGSALYGFFKKKPEPVKWSRFGEVFIFQTA